MVIYNKTQSDQETGYGTLKTEADALKPAEPKKSWRRVGTAVVLPALALGAVAVVKTTSSKRGSQPTAFWYECICTNGVPVDVDLHPCTQSMEEKCESCDAFYVLDEERFGADKFCRPCKDNKECYGVYPPPPPPGPAH